ncbi:MAG: hypothetical protein SFY92_09760 [Verrucomicrobiae bacterium]|nr:hypothetical protein [Verrucomicrobiae bacterium]
MRLRNPILSGLTLFLLAGCAGGPSKDPSVAHNFSDDPSPSSASTASASKSASSSQQGFEEPDDTWKFLRVSTGQGQSSIDQNPGTGYAAVKGDDFRLLIKTVDGSRGMYLLISGNQARIYIGSLSAPAWEGRIDDSVPANIKPFVMMRNVFSVIQSAPLNVSQVKIPYSKSDRRDEEMAVVFLGRRTHQGGYPEDITLFFEKSKLKLSFFIKE